MIRRLKVALLGAILLSGILALPMIDVRAQGAMTAPAKAKSKVKDQYAKLDQWKIHYQSYGKGSDALVFVHGWSCDLTFWDKNAPTFADKRVITVDLIGHGKSDKPDTKYSMDLFARSVQAALKHAGVKRAVLVGHSMGTPVIRQFYRLFPQQTIALVIVDGSLQEFGTPQQTAMLIGALKSPNYKAFFQQFIAPLTKNAATPEEVTFINSVMLGTPQNVVVGGMEAMTDPTIWNNDPIKVPVLAIHAQGPEWTPAYFQYVRSIVPDFQEQMWDGVSHFLFMDNPPKFNSAVASFLTSKNLLK